MKVNKLLSTVYILTIFYSFTLYQLCIEVANLILCVIASVWFSDDPLGIETYEYYLWNYIIII
jgi:hypothetical protein